MAEQDDTVRVQPPALDLSKIHLVIGLVIVIGTPLVTSVANYVNIQNAITNQQAQLSKLDTRVGKVEDVLAELQKERNANLVKYESRLATVESKLDILLQRLFNLAPKESLDDIRPGKPIPDDIIRR